MNPGIQAISRQFKRKQHRLEPYLSVSFAASSAFEQMAIQKAVTAKKQCFRELGRELALEADSKLDWDCNAFGTFLSEHIDRGRDDDYKGLSITAANLLEDPRVRQAWVAREVAELLASVRDDAEREEVKSYLRDTVLKS